jgi:hypothetical protein
MISRLAKLVLLILFIACVAHEGSAQADVTDPAPARRNPRSLDGPGNTQAAMLAKLRLEKDKKDHQAMLDRGEQALRLANQLEGAFEKNRNLSSEDKERLESLQLLVEKIRKELGGNDDGDDEVLNYQASPKEEKPSTMEEAFKFL